MSRKIALKRMMCLFVGMFLPICFCIPADKRPVIAMVTDFGLSNEAVGLCRGVIAAVDPEILVIDLNHTIDSYDIQQASFVIGRADTFPTGTVIMAVVDPGVGTQREAVTIETSTGLILVGPNNGVFTHAMRKYGTRRAMRIDPLKVNPEWKSGTFDGRDLFAPAAARLASDPEQFSELGTSISNDDIIQLPLPEVKVMSLQHSVTGTYIRTDEPYGNVWTDIEPQHMQKAGIKHGDKLRIQCGEADLNAPFVNTFGEVKEGQPLAYIGSAGTLAFAINMGDFRKVHNLESGTTITVSRR